MLQSYISIIIAFFIIIPGILESTFGNENRNYLPLSALELSRSFFMSYVGSIDSEPVIKKLPVGISGADIDVAENGNIIFRGNDKIGKAWSVHMGTPTCGGVRMYAADLDKNGLKDAILWTGTCGSGLAPSSHIITIMFDSQGRPVFFEADGYFDYKDNGFFDMVDLDHNGKAELLYMNFDDGYWITHLYEARDARWQRIKGIHGRRTYPLFTRFTYHANKKPVLPKSGRRPFAPDLSNQSPALQGRLMSYYWANISHAEDIPLTIESPQGRKISCQLVSWHVRAAVVVDNSEGRRIISLSASEEAIKSLLDEIVAHGYTVALYGQGRAGSCSPEILWASSSER